jgi:hypothetical protein
VQQAEADAWEDYYQNLICPEDSAREPMSVSELGVGSNWDEGVTTYFLHLCNFDSGNEGRVLSDHRQD